MKKIIAIALTLTICLGLVYIPAQAAVDFAVRVESKEAKPGDTVELDISLENNAGVVAMVLVLYFDDTYMKLVDAQDGGLIPGHMFGNDYTNIPFKLVWANASRTDFVDNGTLATIKLEVADNAPAGEIPVTIVYKKQNILNADLKQVELEVINGGITVVSDGDNTPDSEDIYDYGDIEEDTSANEDADDEETADNETATEETPNEEVAKDEDKAPADENQSADTAKPETETAAKSMNFADVEETDWFYDAVSFVYNRGIASGISETSYAPLSKVTRAQFVTMLCRAYGIEPMEGDNFADCGDTWYTGYLAAVKQKGISNGVGDNKFAPQKEITREEIVTFIYNYIKSTGREVTTAEETSFTDNDSISKWARPAVAFASSVGYVNGKANNTFDPKGFATRAELAQIFYNMFR